MSIRVMSQVWERPDLDPYERLILLALADHADDEGVCYPSISRLVDRTGMAERGVQKVLKRLAEKGHLSVETNAGRKGTNRYAISLTPAPGAPPHPVHPAPGAPRTRCTPARSAPAPGAPPPHLSAKTPAPGAPEPSGTVRRDDDEDLRAGANSSQPSLYLRVLAAAGMNPSDIPSTWWMPPRAEVEINAWRNFTPGGELTDDLIVQYVAGSAARHRERASRPSAFERGLRDLAATLLKPAAPVVPFPGAAPQPPSNRPHRQLTAEEFQAAVNRGFSGQ